MANYTRVRFVCRNMQRMERFFVPMVVLQKQNEKRASIIYGIVYLEKEKRRADLCGNKCIFAPSSNSHIFIIVFPGLVERYGPDFHFKALFRPIKGEDGTTYHL